MGLHQAITSRTTSVPCDCGADDDHRVYTEADAEDQLVDYDEPVSTEPLAEEYDADQEDEELPVPPEGKGFTTT